MPDVLKDSDHRGLPFRDVSGVVLAGGKSSRYGKNKALVEINGVTLIERVMRVMHSLFQDVILITNTPDEYAHLRLPMHQDLIRGLGPMGGIYTALSAMENHAGFFVACDMPFLNQELIQHMVEIRDYFDVVVPRISQKMEALHALYGKGCLPAIERLIDSRQYQIIQFLSSVSVRYVDEDEIRRFDPGLDSFFNVNRPHELRRFNHR
jgi:molybdopterin-guanine dinucleotide biosynthesis protein A